MTDLSREELRAHLSAVEAQVRAALRIIAAESKSVQQAHTALRADLSAALIRLQSDISSGNNQIDSKVDKAISDINALTGQRKMTTAILTTLVLIFGVTVGILAGGSWFFLQQNRAGLDISLPAMDAPAQPQSVGQNVQPQPVPVPVPQPETQSSDEGDGFVFGNQ